MPDWQRRPHCSATQWNSGVESTPPLKVRAVTGKNRMAAPKSGTLKKDISLLGVFAIALGTTISSIFFLPGMAFKEVGPALMVSYLLAALVVAPPLLCKSELATAMP